MTLVRFERNELRLDIRLEPRERPGPVHVEARVGAFEVSERRTEVGALVPQRAQVSGDTVRGSRRAEPILIRTRTASVERIRGRRTLPGFGREELAAIQAARVPIERQAAGAAREAVRQL